MCRDTYLAEFLARWLRPTKYALRPYGQVVTKVAQTEHLSGDPLSEAVIKEAANECAEFRRVNGNGGCFVAGTLVHTKNGLVPIEKIKVGDWVLSQPEMKGDLAYKRVVNTFVHEDKLVGLIDFFSDVETTLEAARGRLVATRDHPFWVKDVGWTRADHLEAEQILELHDGSTAAVWQYRELRNTEYKDVAWACEFHPDTGPIVDFRGDSFVVDDDDFAQNAYAASLLGGWTERRVFNIEVEGFHTYYVGELGVWVHNSI